MRSKILLFEEALRQVPGAWEGDSENCPLTHDFPLGLYVRTMRIPKGTVLTGKLHRDPHPTILLEGVIQVATEHGGVELLEAPMFTISEAMTKRAGLAVTDVVWITIHPNPNNLTDLAELEEELIVSDLTEYKEELCRLQQ